MIKNRVSLVLSFQILNVKQILLIYKVNLLSLILRLSCSTSYINFHVDFRGFSRFFQGNSRLHRPLKLTWGWLLVTFHGFSWLIKAYRVLSILFQCLSVVFEAFQAFQSFFQDQPQTCSQIQKSEPSMVKVFVFKAFWGFSRLFKKFQGFSMLFRDPLHFQVFIRLHNVLISIKAYYGFKKLWMSILNCLLK